MTEVLITGGCVVTAEGESDADIHIVGEKIKAVGKGLKKKLGPAFTGQVIDAKDCYVIPGGVDPHVHMDLGGSADDFVSGSKAALLGGTTTIIDFANQEKGKGILEALDLWQKKAQGNCYCDYGFHVSVTDVNAQTRPELQKCVERGVTSFKTFTAYKNKLMIDDRQMIEVMREAKRLGALVSVHAENGDIIADQTEQLLAGGKTAPRYHAVAHPALAEAEAASRVVDLAAYVGCPIYLVHLSSAEALERVRSAVMKNQTDSPVFVETCIQYLLLEDSLYGETFEDGAKYVLSPPLRKRKDMMALWKGLAENVIEVVATDHCPFSSKKRELGRNDFSKIPNGVGSVEHRIELLYSDGVEKGKLTTAQWVTLTSTRAAQIFGLYPKKGSIAAGADADLVIFDPSVKHVISAKTHASACDESVYEGRKVQGKCRDVLLRGKIQTPQNLQKGFGQYLKREKFNAGNA